MLKTQPQEILHTTFCPLPYTKIILNAWGEVSMCCHQLTQIGKLTPDSNVLDIWRNNLAKDIRSITSSGQLHPVCTSWNSCPFIVNEIKMYPMQMYAESLYPMYLEICLPDKHCNIGGESPSDDNPACIMCRRNFTINEIEDITDLLCEKSIPLMPYLKYLSVLGIAEPFWKDAVFNIFEKVGFSKYKNHIRFVTNTNGTCLNERTTDKFFEQVEKSEISWSLDAATKETFQKIRRLDAFDLVVGNLKRWLKKRSKNHEVVIYNNINLLNVHEMVKMVELAWQWGVDRMIMLPTYDQAGIIKLGELMLCEKNINIFKKWSEQAMNFAKQKNFKLTYTKPFDKIPPPMQLVQISI